MKRFFLSRTTILTLICLALGAMLVASFVPQAFLLTPQGAVKWRTDYPSLAPLLERLGLNHVYTHPVFACLLFLVVVSLFFSCIEQFKAARRRTFAGAVSGEGSAELRTAIDAGHVMDRLRRRGYIRVAAGADGTRLVRHPWGYWGNFLLHIGMLVVIASSLLIALTQQRGLLHLAVGESFQPGQPWLTTEKGLLARDFNLDRTVRLDGVSYEFRPGYGVKNVVSSITFLDNGNPVDRRAVGVNDILYYGDLRIYQTVEFGHAFYLEVTGQNGGRVVYQLLLEHPTRPEKASYEDYPDMLNSGGLLRLKYFADAEKRSFSRENPLLVVRVDENGRQLGQLPLSSGGEGTIGGYHFRLIKVDKWAGLIFVKLYGISGVFFGFLIIILGSVLNYFTPPREVIVRKSPDGHLLVSWRAAKFGEFYRDEFECLKKELTMGEANG